MRERLGLPYQVDFVAPGLSTNHENMDYQHQGMTMVNPNIANTPKEMNSNIMPHVYPAQIPQNNVSVP